MRVHTGIWRHMRTLWPRWTLLPPLPFLLFGVYTWLRGDFRAEHLALVIAVPVLAYGSATTKRLLLGIYPLGLVGVFYDAMRRFQNVGLSVERVHVCDLRAVELRLFGVGAAGARETLHDFFQRHSVLALDVICAIPYGTFILVAVGFGVYLYFRDFRALQHFGWSFLVVNLLGFATYHLYPAAPPWYFHSHGCTVDLLTKASEGPALARVDALTGLHYFATMYGRASSVFGAVPSLHVAYPFMIVLGGWRILGRIGRALSIGFYVWMCFSAVYLDHHWVVDIVVGTTYCILAFTCLLPFLSARTNAAGVPAKGPDGALAHTIQELGLGRDGGRGAVTAEDTVATAAPAKAEP